MKLVIDNRERDLLQIIGECHRKNLDLGDIIIFDKEDNEVLVIERKTVKDLAISIKDGRHKEQKARLIDCYALKGIKVMYIIEGNIEQKGKISGIPYTTLISSIINTMLRDDIYVYQSKDINDTKDFILAVFKKYCKGNLTHDKEIEYVGEALKLKKKENKNQEDSMIFMLCQVPRISVNIAKAIREHYKSIRDLILAYEGCQDCENMLMNIKISEKRKLGKVASKSIWKYLS